MDRVHGGGECQLVTPSQQWVRGVDRRGRCHHRCPGVEEAVAQGSLTRSPNCSTIGNPPPATRIGRLCATVSAPGPTVGTVSSVPGWKRQQVPPLADPVSHGVGRHTEGLLVDAVGDGPFGQVVVGGRPEQW